MGFTSWKQKYNKKYGHDKEESHSLKEISKDTGVSMKGLQQIYDKGVGAYKTNPESVRPSVNSKEQWAMARVYSAVMGGGAAKVDAKELKFEYGGLFPIRKKLYEGGNIEDYKKWKEIDWDSLTYGNQKKKLYRLLSWIDTGRLVESKLPEEKRYIVEDIKEAMYDHESIEDIYRWYLEDVKWEYDNAKSEDDKKIITDQIKSLGLKEKDFKGDKRDFTDADYKQLASNVGDKFSKDPIDFFTVDDYALDRLDRMVNYDMNEIIGLYDDILDNHGEAVYTEEAEEIQYDLFTEKDMPKQTTEAKNSDIDVSEEDISQLIRGLNAQIPYAKGKEKKELEQLIRGLKAMV